MDFGTQTDKDATAFYEALAPLLADKTSRNDFYQSLTIAAEKQDRGEKGTSLFPPECFQVTPVTSVQEVKQQVTEAIENKMILRVIGSHHSATDAIFSESEEGESTTLLCLTGDLKSVQPIKESVDGRFLTCRVGAGCLIGKPPSSCSSDQTTDDKWEDSLCYQVEQLGYGIPILGGVTYQTVGGFLMTGSAGGSLKHGFSDLIREIEFVDGTGEEQTATPETDLWSAVGVSMGLFGIITYVTLCLPKVGLIKGKEVGYKYEDSSLDKSRLQKCLEDNEYFRLNWFPQPGVNLVQEWSAKQVEPNEAEKKPYISTISCILAAAAAFVVLDVGNYILEVNQQCARDLLKRLYIAGLHQFVPLGPDKQTEFHEKFYLTLPMDNDARVHSFIKVHFTEIWMKISECETIIAKLNKLFRENERAAGNFATEIYGAKESKFWLGMSYGGSYVRVDPYWWHWNCGDKEEFFSFYWEALLDVEGARFHWGKYLPTPGNTYGNQTFNLNYLKSVYPKMDDWLKLRKTHDPHQIFVTKYWRGILEIPRL